MITGLHHVNLIVPPGTLDEAEAFYGKTLGLTPRAVPERQRGSLAWCVYPIPLPTSHLSDTSLTSRYDIGTSGQQVHIAFGPAEKNSSRHPCFRIDSPEGLLELRQRVWEHHQAGGASAPQEADKPGEVNSGAQGEISPSLSRNDEAETWC